MTSTTVSFGYSAAVWRLTPMRGLSDVGAVGRRRRRGPSPAPPSGARSPSRISTVVVLPAPFGPEQAEDLAGRDVEVDPVDREDVAVVLDQAANVDDRRRRDRPRGLHGADGATRGAAAPARRGHA